VLVAETESVRFSFKAPQTKARAEVYCRSFFRGGILVRITLHPRRVPYVRVFSLNGGCIPNPLRPRLVPYVRAVSLNGGAVGEQRLSADQPGTLH
jgi:hypothetical protein